MSTRVSGFGPGDLRMEDELWPEEAERRRRRQDLHVRRRHQREVGVSGIEGSPAAVERLDEYADAGVAQGGMGENGV